MPLIFRRLAADAIFVIIFRCRHYFRLFRHATPPFFAATYCDLRHVAADAADAAPFCARYYATPLLPRYFAMLPLMLPIHITPFTRCFFSLDTPYFMMLAMPTLIALMLSPTP